MYTPFLRIWKILFLLAGKSYLSVVKKHLLKNSVISVG